MSEKKVKEQRRADRTKSLSVFERLILRNILPARDTNIGVLELVLKINGDLFDATEWEALEVGTIFACPKCDAEEKGTEAPQCPNCDVKMENTNKIGWNVKDKEGKELPNNKEIKFGPESCTLIEDILKKLNEANKISMEHYSLYKKFI